MKNSILLFVFLAISSITYSQTKDSMTDSRDGEIYETVTYNINGKQITWMAQNLRYETEGASVYDNVSSYKKKLGLLYTSNAVNSSCPKGWHLPTVSEWESLTALFGGYYKASKTLKSERGWEWNEKLAEGLERLSRSKKETIPVVLMHFLQVGILKEVQRLLTIWTLVI